MSKLTQTRSGSHKPNILYVGLKYDYGDTRLGFSYEYLNLYDSMVRSDQYNIDLFPFDEIMRKVGREEMNRLLLNTVRETKPDCCFFVLFTDEIKKATIRQITEKSGSLTFNWFCDDHWRFDTFSKGWAPLFHWASTTDSAAVDKYFKIGYKNVIKTQWAFNPGEDLHSDIPYQHDVTFIGQVHSDRKRIITRLKRDNIRVECRGKGWEGGRLTHEEMIRVYSASKINLNFTRSSIFPGLKQFAKIVLNRRADDTFHLNNPAQILGNLKIITRPQRSQIKARNFEITGNLGFLLTEDADNLMEYFVEGSEIVIFSGVEDLKEKILYYLSHDSEREKIRNAGYRRTLQEHTYERRTTEIFNAMKLK